MNNVRYIAVLAKNETTEKRAILVPIGQSLEFDPGTINREWLHPHLGTDWHLVEFIPLEFSGVREGWTECSKEIALEEEN